MRILILGAGRPFFGRRAAELLAAAGHAVTVFNRASSPVPGARHVLGDRDDPAALGRVLNTGPGFDCVIDNIAYRPEQVEALLPLLAGRARHYVLTSSFSVYGAGTGPLHPVTEDEADLSSTAGDDYEVGKRRCEAALVRLDSRRVPWTVLRLANVEGPGDPSNRRGFFADRVADGGGLLVPSDVSVPIQALWRDDAARALALVAGNPEACGKVYNIAGQELLTLAEWLGLIADALGVQPPFILQLPFDDLRRLAGFEYRLPLGLRPLLDISRARQSLGFGPTPAAAWLPAMVAWWRASGLTSRFWEHRPREVEAIRRAKAALGLS